eukprot:GEMP01083778.1.p1 GENE.GEMP01083778.1~~GEMP01083778.1.p1  ORF type:complete len:161 (+),score=37.74 GEMP01083778.1:125-607(+)
MDSNQVSSDDNFLSVIGYYKATKQKNFILRKLASLRGRAPPLVKSKAISIMVEERRCLKLRCYEHRTDVNEALLLSRLQNIKELNAIQQLPREVCCPRVKYRLQQFKKRLFERRVELDIHAKKVHDEGSPSLRVDARRRRDVNRGSPISVSQNRMTMDEI